MRTTMRERHDAKREEALADIRAKVADGSLTIRQMTDEERARYSRVPTSDRARPEVR